MAQDQAIQFLTQGINAAKAGQKDQARQLFQNALRLDPQNETAWLWMSSVARDNRERLFCLQNLLQVNPNNEMALKGLRALGVDPATLIQQAAQQQTQAAAPAEGVPPVERERLNTVLTAVDAFLRGYNPLPASDLPLTQKKGRRYGEIAAVRRRAMRVSVIAGVAVVGLIILAVILMSVLSGEEVSVTQEASFPTLTPSFTPTDTPTATPGATNTPSPVPDEPLIVTFVPPAGLPRGSIYGGTATPIYPDIPAGAGRIQQAVALYSIGDYPDAFGTLSAERQLSTIQCYPAHYFYQAVGLAEQGGRRNLEDALALLNQADERPECQDDPLTLAGYCYVYYAQSLESNSATDRDLSRNFCQASVDESDTAPPIPLAMITLAKLDMKEGSLSPAQSTLDQALRFWPSDIHILLARAELEVQRNDLLAALEYIERALYIDPASIEALAMRVEAYLGVAAQEEDTQRRVQLYGTAVLWTQEFLLFYAGDPTGYLLLARARLGEGNIDLAEEALNRILLNEANLPETERSTIQQAYALRSQIYQQTTRYELALQDVQVALAGRPDDAALLERQGTLAYQLGRYALALESINNLVSQDASRTDLRLLRLKLTTQICAFNNTITCDYETALTELTDEFIAALTPAQQAEALTYRAAARYHQAESLQGNELTRAYREALTDVQTALQTDQSPFAMYYQGLIQEGLENPAAALTAYQWITYWSQFYNYPFAEQVQTRIEALQETESS